MAMNLKRGLYLFIVIGVTLFGGVCRAEGEGEPNGVAYPDPGRWSKDMQTFAEWDSKNSFPSDAVLFVGSSSIRLWPTAEAFGAEYPVINRGFGGSYVADSVHYSETLILKYKPKVVVVFAGTNDVAGKIPAARVHRDFVRLVEIIHAALPETEILCLPITPTQSRWHLQDKMQEVNALNKDFAAERDYVTFVDVASAFFGADGQPDAALFLADQLHLNEKGYEKWNIALAPVLRDKYARAMKETGQ
jgi:lysophospholipase L1-like esterase